MALWTLVSMLWTYFSWAVSLSVMLFSSCLIWLIRSVALGAGNCPWEQRELSLLSSESVIRFTVNEFPQIHCWMQPPPLLSLHRNSCLKCTKPAPPPFLLQIYTYLCNIYTYSFTLFSSCFNLSLSQLHKSLQSPKLQNHSHITFIITATVLLLVVYIVFI